MPGGIKDTLQIALQKRSRASTLRLMVGLLVVLFAVDGTAAVLLRQMPSVLGIAAVDWHPSSIERELGDFDTAMADLLVLLVLRAGLLAALAVVGVRVGVPDLSNIRSEQQTTEPLLCTPVTVAGSGDAPVEHLESHRRKKIADQRKNLALASVFAVSTASQVYVGIKCISYEGRAPAAWSQSHSLVSAQGCLLGLTVALINVEAFFVTNLIHLLTAEAGFFVPEFHEHRLFFHAGLPGHVCDLCRSTSDDMYRCPVCDWDACPACFKKKDKSTGEGVMRGDKGVKKTADVGRWVYFKRAVRLVAPHVPLFLVSICCLVATAGLNLFLPNFQGEIFDHVIAAHHTCVAEPASADCAKSRHGFFSTVSLYLALSVALGVIASLKELSFSVVSRRIAIWVRKRLFRIMLRQDIAFFDGMRTGDLQSRVSEDISAMVSPIQYSLSQFLSNTILLFGGVAMCFFTSWRLSMIAFTTVLPMMHVTSVYADWSGRINQQRYQLLSDAQSRMGEAINNVRTVRAVSSEEHESVLNDTTLERCLRIGIRDACFSSLTAAFNNCPNTPPVVCAARCRAAPPLLRNPPPRGAG